MNLLSATTMTALFFWATGAPALADDQTTTCAKDDDTRRIDLHVAASEDGLPCKVIYSPVSEDDTMGIVSWDDLPSREACKAQADGVIVKLTGEGWTCTGDAQQVVSASFDKDLPEGLVDIAAEEIDEPAELVANPDVKAPSDDLVALIQSDLGRLDTTVQGSLKAEIAGYGDLNDDGTDDALVFFTYASPQPAYRQFLAAYMLDDDTYRLTATRPIGGNLSATKEASLEEIDDGVVHLILQAFEPGDASCCPTGERHLALALRDLDLVEIDGN